DESGRWLLEVVGFQVDGTAQARAKVVLKRGDGQCAIKAVEKIVDVGGARAATQKEAKAERWQRFHTILTRAIAGWLRRTQLQLELSPIISGAHKFQIAAVQTCKIAGQVQSESVASNSAAKRSAAEAFEDVLLRIRCNRLSGVANRQSNLSVS